MAKLIKRNPFDEAPAPDLAQANTTTRRRSSDAAPATGSANAAVMRRINFDVPDELHRKLRIKSAAEGVTVAEVFRRFAEQWAEAG